MSANEVWARLGGDVDGIGLRGTERDTLHGVEHPTPGGFNHPAGVPFDSSDWPRTVPDQLPRAADQRFEMGDAVEHLRTRRVYVILDTPSSGLTIEASARPAYMYRALDMSDPRKWVRPQTEMEDGRFALRKPAPSRRLQGT